MGKQGKEAVDDGGRAFPAPGVWDVSRNECNPVNAYYDAGGMSLRAYLAGQALAGIASRIVLISADTAAEAALEYADALIAKLNKGA